MTSSERRAVGFLAALAAAGAGARALGLGDPPGARAPTAADRLALQHQLDAVDSAHAGSERAHARGKRGRAGRRARGGAADGATAGATDVAVNDAMSSHADRAASAARAPREFRRAPALPATPAVVDVNAADSAALEALSGVGPALARRIVADRAAHGGYASLRDLSRVPGIGPALERRLAGTVTFTPGGRPSSGSGPAPTGVRRTLVDGAPRGWPAP